MIVKIDIDNLCDVDNNTLFSLMELLLKEKNKRENEKREIAIARIESMLEEIDDLCIEENISITTPYEYLKDEVIIVSDLKVG